MADARTSAPTSLYISYDGLLEPLGQSQILPYLRGLTRSGLSFALLTFEKPADLARRSEVDRLRAECSAHGIRWVPLRYHKWPSVPATAWDVLRGTLVATSLALWWCIPIIHCRSYVAAVIGRLAATVCGARLLFDMRGFWPEERVEGGLWPASGRLFSLTKRIERRLLRASDAVIVLTERARAELSRGAYARALSSGTTVAVIPCCVDLDKFAAPNAYEARPADSGPRTLVYAGSIGTWYMLDEMLDFFREARALDPRLRFLIVTRSGHEAIREAALARGLDEVALAAALPREVPGHLAAAYAAISFIRPVFSKSGSSPTKLGEYLAAGLPVIVNAGVGDADTLVDAARVGVVVGRFSADEYRRAWGELDVLAADPGVRARCRATARRVLDLDIGVEQYRQVYASLLRDSPRSGEAGVVATRVVRHGPSERRR